MDRALEIVDPVETNTDRRAARPLRREVDVCRAFLDAVDVIPELAAVVDCRDVIPHAERMQTIAIEQRLARVGTVDVTVQTPLPVDDTNLEQHAVVAAVLLQVEPSLLGSPAIGAEDRLPRECLSAGQRMRVDEQRIVDTVEFDGHADWRLDDARVADDSGGMIAEAIEAIEFPRLALSERRRGEGLGSHRRREPTGD